MSEYEKSDFNVLIGKKIIKVENLSKEYDIQIFNLICDDGTIIEISSNEGCSGCGNGWSSIDDLSILEDSENIITNVIKKYNGEKTCIYDEIDDFQLFVIYEMKQLTINGDDGYGNGYYGGGFYITIKDIKND